MKTTKKILTIEVVNEKGTITETHKINVGKDFKLLLTMDKNTHLINLDDYKISKINVWTDQTTKL
jgi:hypothetical protein